MKKAELKYTNPTVLSEFMCFPLSNEFVVVYLREKSMNLLTFAHFSRDELPTHPLESLTRGQSSVYQTPVSL